MAEGGGDVERFYAAVRDVFSGAKGGGSEWLSELEKNSVHCVQVCSQVLLRSLSQRQSMPLQDDQNLCDLLASQLLHKSVKRRAFFEQDPARRVELREFLLSFLLSPVTLECPRQDKVVVQLCLVVGALAVQGSQDGSWNRERVLEDLWTATNAGDSSKDRQGRRLELLLEMLRRIAEQSRDPSVFVSQPIRESFVAFLSNQAPLVLTLIEKIRDRESREENVEKKVHLIRITQECVVAWLEAELVSCEHLLADRDGGRSVLSLTIDTLPLLTAAAEADGIQTGSEKVTLLSDCFELLRACSSIATGHSFQQALASLQREHIDHWRAQTIARARVRDSLMKDAVPVLLSTVKRLVQLQPSHAEDVSNEHSDALKVAANAGSALCAAACSTVSGYEELIVIAMELHETEEHLDKYLSVSTLVFEQMSQCMALPAIEVQAACFEFWYFCQEKLKSILTLSSQIGPNHPNILRVLGKEKKMLASILEEGIAKIVEETSSFPEDVVFCTQWDQEKRVEFKHHRRDIRDVLRDLFQDQIELCKLLQQEEQFGQVQGEQQSSFFVRFLQWELSCLTEWKEAIFKHMEIQRLKAKQQQQALDKVVFQDHQWRRPEAMLHALSAVLKLLPDYDLNAQEHISSILDCINSVFAISVMQQPNQQGSGTEQIAFHRVFLRTVALFCGVVVKATPKEDLFLQQRGSNLLHILILCLYVPGDNPCYPFRDGEDHCGAVSFAKMCFSSSFLPFVVDALLANDRYLFRRLVQLFQAESSPFKPTRENGLQVYVNFRELNAEGMILDIRSTELLLQSLMMVLFSIASTGEESACQSTIQNGLTQIISRHIDNVKLAREAVQSGTWSLASRSPEENVICFSNSLQFLACAAETAGKVFLGQQGSTVEHRTTVLEIIKHAWFSAIMYIGSGGGALLGNVVDAAGQPVAAPMFERFTRFSCALINLSLDLSEFGEVLNIFPYLRKRIPLFQESQVSLAGLESHETFAILDSLHAFFQNQSRPWWKVHPAVVDSLVTLLTDISASLLELARRDWLFYLDCPKTTVKLLRLFTSMVLNWACVEGFGDQWRRRIATIISNVALIAVGTHSNVSSGTSTSSAKAKGSTLPNVIQDQDVAGAIIQFERVVLMGPCKDSVDPFQPLPGLPRWYLECRNHLFEQQGLGQVYVRGILLGAAGQLPPWAIDRISLTMRGMLGQFGETFFSWLVSVLAEKEVPYVGVSDKTRALFLESLRKEKNISAPAFKRILKKFCGGKRKGEKVNRPSEKPKTRETFVR